MKLVVAVVRPDRLSVALERLFGGSPGADDQPRPGQAASASTSRLTRHDGKDGAVEKVRLEIGVSDNFVETTVNAILHGARTGAVGDGKVFVLPVEKIYRIRTGEEDRAAVTPVGVPA